jgi:MOSC domain-containing protein YiiM
MRLTHPETLRGLVHRGGLVAEVLNDGELKVGDVLKIAGRESNLRTEITNQRVEDGGRRTSNAEKLT